MTCSWLQTADDARRKYQEVRQNVGRQFVKERRNSKLYTNEYFFNFGKVGVEIRDLGF